MKQVSKWFGLLLVLGQCWATENEVINQDKIKQQVQAVYPEMVVDTIKESPVSGLYQLTAGPVVLYASNDGRYLLAGDMLDLEQIADNRNITEEVRRNARVISLNRHIKEAIVYRGGEVKSIVTVFTDPDCGYCRKLHEEIPKLLDLGIEVRYLAYPRQGMGSSTYTKMESVWCSNNRKEAMDHIMSGDEIKTIHCKNTIPDQMALGQKIGINGTPTLIFADGTLYGGYLSAAALAREALKHSRSE